jgi:tRNA modification GTPase
MSTIAALATPPGRGAIAIVRVSGPDARAIVARVFSSREPLRDRGIVYGTIRAADGAPIDRALALTMAAPRSVTGEDVIELQLHGSPLAARETLRALLAAGATHAAPGEFTQRAFLNGKLDLSAAEAVADVIDAETRAAVHASQANLAGALRRAIDAQRVALQTALEDLGGAIDYPDEVPEPDRAALAARIDAIDGVLAELERDGERGRLVREGYAVAIAGPPNAGKSSLLNALLADDRAIVSEVAGTTRDTLEERIAIGGVPVRLIDTAGLRETADAIEQLGIARTERAIATAALVLVVIDGSVPLGTEARALLERTRARPRVVLFNKADRATAGYDARDPHEADALVGSVFTPATLDAVRAAIARHGWGGETIDLARAHLANVRHADAVARARRALADARATLAAAEPLDLISGDLVAASAALGEITGAAVTEETLAGIFARFCIGK